MKAFLLICVSALACSCASHEVRCDGRLTPVNAPAGTASARPRAATVPGDL